MLPSPRIDRIARGLLALALALAAVWVGRALQIASLVSEFFDLREPDGSRFEGLLCGTGLSSYVDALFRRDVARIAASVSARRPELFAPGEVVRIEALTEALKRFAPR